MNLHNYRTFTFRSVYLWNIIFANVATDVSFLRFEHILKHFDKHKAKTKI